jgi:hypothetical protein
LILHRRCCNDGDGFGVGVGDGVGNVGDAKANNSINQKLV